MATQVIVPLQVDAPRPNAYSTNMGRAATPQLKAKGKSKVKENNEDAIDKVSAIKMKSRGSKRRGGSKKTTRKTGGGDSKIQKMKMSGKDKEKDVDKKKKKVLKTPKPPVNLSLINGESKNE